VLAAAFLIAAYGALGAAIGMSFAAAPGDVRGGLWEIVVRACIAALASWVGVSWVLALVGALVVPAVLACALVSGVTGVAVLVRIHRRAERAAAESVSPWVLAVMLPVAAWAIYATARSIWVPVENHDALAYHLPRAVLFLLDHGYRLHRDIVDGRLATWPADYELLMANILVLGQSDQGTVLIGIMSYLGLAAVGASLCTRWWGRSYASVVVFALVACTPLAILHSGAHKNDLLFALAAAAAVQWLVPWAYEGKIADAIYGVAALGLAVGTKVHGVFLVVFAAPLLVAGALRVRPRRRLVPLIVYGLLVATLLGGCVIVLNLAQTGSTGLVARTFQDSTGALYGDWGNLWKFPIVMLLAPFTSSSALWVPWCKEPYWWNQFDIYQSHFGAAFSLAALAIPILEWQRRGRDAGRRERWLSVGIVIVTFAAVLPLHVRPFGFFFNEARYYLALMPFVFAWACGGLWRSLEGARVSELPLTATGLALSGAWLCWNYIGCARNDTYQPFDYVAAAATAPEPWRSPPAQLFHQRIGYLVDKLAGARDVVAVDLGYDTWLYPMFGQDFRRPIRFLPPTMDRTVIPADATWVAIDRGQQEFFFTSPALIDLRLSLMRKYFGKGTPVENNFKIFRELSKDPRFERVFYNPSSNQALFHRKP
jgi:hypothetical protein